MKKRFLGYHKSHILKKSKRLIALSLATVLLFSVFYIPPISMGSIVYADDDTSSQQGNAGDAESEENKEKKPFDIKTSRVAFYEWRKVTCDNFKTIFSDNKHHLSMLIPCYYNKTVPKNKLYDDSDGSVSANGYILDHNNPVAFKLDYWVQRYRGTADYVPYPGEPAMDYGLTFFSTYGDDEHIFLPTEKNDSHHDEYKNTFKQAPYTPEDDKSPYPYSYQVYYNKSYGASHSPAYWKELEKNVFIDQDHNGFGYDEDKQFWYIENWADCFGKDRFFTQNDMSYGMPFIKAAQMSSDECKMAVDFVLENEPLSAGEVRNFQDTGKYWHLYCGVPDDEPMMYMKHGDNSFKQDYLHMVCPCNPNSKTGRAEKGKNKDIWVICAFNNNLDNDDNWCDFGTGCMTGDDDYCYLTYLPNNYKYEWIMQASKKQYGTCNFMWYVGTPHVFTAIDTQTINSGDFAPFKTGDFQNGDSKADFSEGVMLPEDNVLTVDGGVVSIECNFINNGKIVVKNGGTLIIKKGGTISPYTKDSIGTIECDNGSIIVMEGATVYAIKDSAVTTIKLTTGASYINYGTTFFTTVAIDKGSKLENRKKGVLVAGMIRKDQLAFLYESPPDKSQGRYKDSNVGYLSAGKYSDLTGVVNAGLVKDIERKDGFLYISVASDIRIGVVDVKEDKQYRITYKDGSSESYIVKNAKVTEADNQVLSYLIQKGIVQRSEIGVTGIGDGVPNIKVEKTSFFQHTDNSGADYAAGANIIVPEY